MIDSTGSPCSRGFEQRGRSRRCQTPSTGRPRWTPTSTLSAPRFIARLTISCPKRRERPSPGHDAEVVTLCVAQAIMGIPSDRRFLAVARKRLRAPVPRVAAPARLSNAAGARLTETIEWLMGVFASRARASTTSCVLIDSRPIECARSRETVERSALVRPPTTATAPPTRASSGACVCTRCSPPTAPRGRSTSLRPCATNARSRSSCLQRGRAWAETAARRQRLRRPGLRPGRSRAGRHGRTSRAQATRERSHLAPIRQRIESIFWTCKDLLTLERHGARTLAGLRVRVLQRFLPGRLHRAQLPARAPQPGPGRLRRMRWRGINHLGRLGRIGLEPARRYERSRPGELIHIDVKKLGRIGPTGPVTG